MTMVVEQPIRLRTDRLFFTGMAVAAASTSVRARSSRSAVAAWPEKSKILHAGSNWRMRIAASMPFMSGMITSLITRSGRTAFAFSTADVPVYTAAASKPC